VRALTKKLAVPLEPRMPDFGRSFEHFIVLETIAQAIYRRSDFIFSFYRTESGAEVDLIVEPPRGDVYAVEIKSTGIIGPSHLRGLRSFAEVCPSAKLCVRLLCRVDRQPGIL
jgi:predicted AAA+ superfamily ATPase